MTFLDPSHFEVDLSLNPREIIIKNDANELAYLGNRIKEFYVSFIPVSNDRELTNYRFSFDPTKDTIKTMNMNYWEVLNLGELGVIPNLDAFYYLDEGQSTLQNTVSYASQIAAYINNGEELEFNIAGENPEIVGQINDGDYLAMYIETNIKNIESLDYITIKLYDNSGVMSTQIITRDELIMQDNTIRIALSTSINTLKTIRFIPTFTTNKEYSDDNTHGISQMQTIQWDSNYVSFMDDDKEYMQVELEYDLKSEIEGFELAYIYDDELQYLTFPVDTALSSTVDDYGTGIDTYMLHIPKTYLHPETSQPTDFQEEQIIMIRYNTPVKKGIAIGIGKMYFESKGYNYIDHPDLPKAEFLLVDAENEKEYNLMSNDDFAKLYSEFIADYYYQAPLNLTPFDTEYNGRYKTVKIDLDLTSLYASTGSDMLNFSYLIFSVPNPSYELTVSEVLILEEAYEPTIEHFNTDSRIWQYSEVETFTASATPETDSYQLVLEDAPSFYPDIKWLDYLNIFDEDGNYYTAGVTGNDHQLHYEPSTDTFTWNPAFNQFPEYFGMEFEEPLVIEPEKKLYFTYTTATSWTEPIRIDIENVDLSSIRMIYDYNYLLKPEYYDWYSQQFGVKHSYESIAYSFKDEPEYEVVQYYYEDFIVYENTKAYTHTFDIGDLSFEDDFINVEVYKLIGLTPTLESVILTDDADYSYDFDKATKELTITSDIEFLDSFDQLLAILNYSYGPISSYSEIFLSDEFNQTYLSDLEETFYSSVDIDYSHSTKSGKALLAESSTTITSDTTLFKSIDYCRNPEMSIGDRLIGYGSELFDNFEIYKDESSIIYVADIDMDSEPDYKHTIDINRDSKIDIVKYGIDDPQGSVEIYWHTIIQDFENEEINVERSLEDEKRTEWFDINDRKFAHYDFNVAKLLIIALTLPLLPYHISKMMLPDVDYWAQKSTQTLIDKEEYIKSTFYSVKVDNDRDGYADTQINYETTDVDTYYEITEYKKTILAAKTQNVFTFLGEYVVRSIGSLFGGSGDDAVFDEDLTENNLETGDFSSCNKYVQKNGPVLRSTYRKFTEEITTTYIDTFEESTITVFDWEEGDIAEQRIYTDSFETGEIEEVSEFFSGLSTQHSVTNIDTGQQITVDFDPNLPFTHAANLTWQSETWGSDNIPVKYDSLQVIGDNSYYRTNKFEKTIIIRIPNRFSLYNDYGETSKSQREDDGWVEFKVKGVLITPPDGQVYYTADVESFIDGSAKTDGHYFYVDSDLNNFYETVYILSYTHATARDGTPKYNVMSIGQNNDGIHDFAPYERLNKKEISVSNFDNLAMESARFGTDWVYNFDKLRKVKILWDQESILEEYGLKPKDNIFEIYKLVETSEQNSKFPKLFYEIRHETYSTAWEQYHKQLVKDIAEQVFMSVTAGVLSAFVEASITASTLGFGYLAAKAASVLVYFAVYTLMTKFSIDAKLHESKAISRSGIFYSVSDGVKSPTSLNEKSFADRFLQDSMAAALLGHPGGYYMTVTGGEPGNMYEGNLLVSPPRFGRLGNTNLLEDIGGFMRLLSDNLLNMGKSDSDAFTALDFDDTNLNYLLLTSELPSYNRYDYYTYYNTNDKASVYDAYSTNTLGFLESKIKRISNNQFDTIQPTIINGVPSYNFINSTLYQKILPQSILYKPIVLSESRYNQLTPGPGLLTITVQCKDFPSTKGIYAYGLLRLERHAGYKAKIPLKGKSFEYPIETISIDVISEGYMGEKNYLRHVRVDESYYTIEEGNLYFIKSLEEIISESYQEFEDSIEHDWLADFTGAYIYYDINIVFDRIIPDTTDETNSLALAQATFYTIMDYFNQYTYAQVSANMISEIAYTETLTFWSTLISVPLIYFGSAIATGAVGSLGAAAGSMLVKMVYSPMKEIIQEITEDAFIEVLAENFADMVGLSDDVGYWLSALGTSGRELGGSLRSASVSSSQSSQTDIALATAQNSGDANINLEMQNTLNENLQQQQQADLNQEQEKSQWKTLYQSKFFKGLMMVSTSLLLAPMTPTGLLAFAGIRTMVSGEIRNFGISRTKTQAYRKALVQYITKDHSTLAENIESQMKKPRNLDGEALNKLFRKSQGDGNTIDMPSIQTAPSISPNPKQIQRSNLFNKLKEISLFKGFSDIAFALEAFRMLYPEGYGGFNDPMLGLQAWGSDRGLDTTHLTFWGGLSYDIFELKEDLEEIERNERRIEEYDDYNDFDLASLSFFRSPSKEMNINDYLTKELQLTDRILEYNIYVNGKEIDPSFWTELTISPEDSISIVPYTGLLAQINFIEAKIRQEIQSKQIQQQRLSTDPNFLSPSEVKTLNNFYSQLTERFYDRGTWTAGTFSQNAVHYKFFIDQLTTILLENNVISDSHHKTISQIISQSGSERAYSGKLSKMKNGVSNHFDLKLELLDMYYGSVYYEVENMFRSNRIDKSQRDNALSQVENLFNTQYSLYGYKHVNPLFNPIRHAYLKLVQITFKAGVLGTTFNQDDFNAKFSFDASFYRNFNVPTFIPFTETYVNLRAKIMLELSSTSYSYLNPSVASIINDIIDAISNQRRTRDLINEIPNARKPEFRAKRDLIDRIINCPDTDILKMTDKLIDLDFLLFNHPSYARPGRKFSSSSYLSDVYFKSPTWKSLAKIDALLNRITTLELSDFAIVNLGGEINSETLEKLKEHSRNVVYDFIEEHNINNMDLVGITYQNKEIRDLQLDAIRAVRKAAAYYKENLFITFSKAFQAFEFGGRFYTHHVTSSEMMRAYTVVVLISKLNDFISKANSEIFTSTPQAYFAKIRAYLDAQQKLIEYQQLRTELMQTWRDSDAGVRTWFDKLFIPSSRAGYAYAWDKDPLYRAWAVSTDLADLYGTELMSGDSIPDSAFDASDPSMRYGLHHKEGTNTMSLALYDHVLTYEKYHPLPIGSMSSVDLTKIQDGIRKLFDIGINKDESTVTSERGINQWVTLNDFKSVFPDTQEFEFRYDGVDYSVSLYEMWSNIFTDRQTFEQKLDAINKKIQTYRDALALGLNPYEQFLLIHYPVAAERFLSAAREFMDQFIRLADAGLLGTHSVGELVNIWYIYLARKTFNLD